MHREILAEGARDAEPLAQNAAQPGVAEAAAEALEPKVDEEGNPETQRRRRERSLVRTLVCKWSSSPLKSRGAEAAERGEEAEAAAAGALGAAGARWGRAEALAVRHIEHAEPVGDGTTDHDCVQQRSLQSRQQSHSPSRPLLHSPKQCNEGIGITPQHLRTTS